MDGNAKYIRTGYCLAMKILYLLLMAVALKALVWSLALPMFEGPDEQAHFAMVQFLSEEGRLPQGREYDLSKELLETEKLVGTFRNREGNNAFTYHPEYRIPFSDHREGVQESKIRDLNTKGNRQTYVWREAARYPPLFYVISSVGYWLTWDADLIGRFFAVRLMGVIWAVLLALVAYKTGQVLFEKTSWAVALAALTTLHPMVSFVQAGINSDNLHMLLSTVILYWCCRLLKNGWEVQMALYVGLVLGLDLVTKPQGYILGLFVGLACVVRIVQQKSWREHVKPLLIVFCTVLLVAGWQEVPVLYHLLFGTNPYLPDAARNMNPEFVPFLRYSINRLYAQNIIWYWGVFKWLGVVLPRPMWWITNRLVLAAGIGVLMVGYKAVRRWKSPISVVHLLFLVITSVLYVAAIFVFDWEHYKIYGYSFGVQGRYYLPLVTAHMALLMVGLSAFGIKDWMKTWIIRGLVVWFLAMQTIGLYTILSIYYQLQPVDTLIDQISQYKPAYAKGILWYMWSLAWAGAMGTYLYLVVGMPKRNKET